VSPVIYAMRMANERKTSIGAVIIRRAGKNPYRCEEMDHPYSSGDGRANALRVFRDTGQAPEGFAFWCDHRRRDLTRDEIDWSGMSS
jgi:hypothetical protein